MVSIIIVTVVAIIIITISIIIIYYYKPKVFCPGHKKKAQSLFIKDSARVPIVKESKHKWQKESALLISSPHIVG